MRSLRVPPDGIALTWLAAASFLFRAPALSNAPGMINSDVAVVGLQANHFLRGEWAWFLPGSGYQTSVDSAFAALLFSVFGAGALSLVLTALLLHVIATLLAYLTLRRHLSVVLSTLLAMLLVFTPTAVHTFALHPPRQAALTLVFLAFFLLDGASRRARPWSYAAGGAVSFLAAFADPYALVFLPALAVLGVLALFDAGADRRRRALWLVSGFAVGAVPFVLLRLSPRATGGQLHFDSHDLAHNLRLLRECLPWATSAVIHYAPTWADYEVWNGGAAVGAMQKLGAVVLLGGSLSGLAFAFRKATPWPLRRLGFAGALVLPLTLAGFALSVMVMDLFSARYLASIVLAAPFALAPLAARLAELGSAVALAPYLASAGLCGWLGYHPLAEGLRITRLGAGDDEAKLEHELSARGLRYATGDYWATYRLTFLWNERIVAVPNHLHEDRFADYRPAFEAAPRYAYVFDRRRSRETFEKLGPELEPVEQFDVASYSVFVVDRTKKTRLTALR